MESSLPTYLIEFAEFVPSDGDDLGAFSRLLYFLLQLATQVSLFEERFTLQLSKLERIGVACLLGSLEAKDNRSGRFARQVVFQALLQFFPGLGRGL